MSELVPTKMELPAYLQGYESESTDTLVTGTVILPRISLRGKQFRFRKDDKEKALPLGQALNVVVLGAAPRKGFSKVYYEEAYKEGSDDMPTCSSSSGNAPDSWCESPQSKTCDTCPHNAFGSGVDSQGNPTKGKACSDTKQLLVLPPDQPDGEMWAMRVPPASLRLMSNYASDLKRHRLPIEGVVTQVQFVDAEYPKIEFKFHGFIDDKYAMKFLERVNSDEFRTIVDQISNTLPVESVSEPVVKAASSQNSTSITDINWDDDVEEVQVKEQPAKESKARPVPTKPVPTKQAPIESAQPSGRDAKKAVKAPDGSYFVDEYGNVFNPEDHAKQSGCMGGALKKDGSFKARRAAGASQPEPSKPTPAKEKPPAPEKQDFGFGGDVEKAEEQFEDDSGSDESDLQSILDEWG